MEDEGWEKEGGVMVFQKVGGASTMISLITRLEPTKMEQ